MSEIEVKSANATAVYSYVARTRLFSSMSPEELLEADLTRHRT